jgi:hypothetical protein
MFSFRIINSAKFLQMPEGSQLLYFHLAMRADDDGVVEAYPVLKLLGSAPDTYKVLIAKGFIVELNSEQVSFVTDWNEHNTIRADRKVNSVYLPLLLERNPDAQVLEPKPRSDVDDNSRRVDRPRTAEGRLGKVRLGQDSSGELQAPEEPPTPKREASISYVENLEHGEIERLTGKYAITERDVRTIASRLVLYCTSKGRRYKNYKAALENWIAKDFKLRDTSNSKYAKYS